MGRTEHSGGSSDAETLWARCLEIIRDNVSEQVFKTWFESMRPQSWDGNQLTLDLPSQFFYEWIEEHYSSLLQKTVQKVLGAKARLQYQVVVDEGDSSPEQRTIKLPAFRKQAQQPLPFEDQPSTGPKPAASPTHYPTYFNPRYTFENFIRGENNQLATSAAMAVADNPGKTRYNPLVIYGPTG
ncbi:MAG: chromosomal replication initiator protein DnaA, partial [Ignavibacteriae bacterium]